MSKRIPVNQRRRHVLRLEVLAFVLLAPVLLLLPAQSKERRGNVASPDANALVRRMIATYQSAQTFEETSEAKIKASDNPEYIQQTTLRFKRPNLLYLASEDPNIGTYHGYCSGKVITLYTGALNTYTKRNSPAGLRPTLSKLATTGAELMGIPIVQMLSPVGFMIARDTPDECKNFQFVRTETLEGSKVVVVTGPADAAFLHTLKAPPQTVFDKKQVTLWIDAERNLLRKASFNLQYRIVVSASGNKFTTPVNGGMKFEEVHRNIHLNTPFRDEDFFFVPPKGSAERFQDRK